MLFFNDLFSSFFKSIFYFVLIYTWLKCSLVLNATVWFTVLVQVLGDLPFCLDKLNSAVRQSSIRLCFDRNREQVLLDDFSRNCLMEHIARARHYPRGATCCALYFQNGFFDHSTWFNYWVEMDFGWVNLSLRVILRLNTRSGLLLISMFLDVFDR